MRRQLYKQLLLHIARDALPDRPGRREPRALKRRPKPYPFLTCHPIATISLNPGIPIAAHPQGERSLN